MKKYAKIIFTFIIIAIIMLFVANPAQNIKYTLDGLNIWAKNLLPALFPFFFLSRLLFSLGQVERLGNIVAPVTRRLYHVPGSSGLIYIMSIISGYPMGAKLVSDMYLDGKITRSDAMKITSFTSTSGPLFIIGTVAIGMFHSARLGIILLICHMFGALLNGLLYRNIGKSSRKIKQNKKNFASNETTIAKTALVTSNHNALNFAHINIYPSCNIMPKLANTNATRKCNKLAKEDSSADSSQTKASHNTTTTRIFAGVPQKVDNVLEDAMYGSIKSILIVGGYVTLFYLLISMLSDYQILKILAYPVQVILGLFHIDPAIGLAIASGAFEMTSGCLDLSLAAIPINAVAPALSFIIGFGGISVFMQAYTFLKSFDMSAGKFFLMKFSQGILSMLCCMAFVFML